MSIEFYANKISGLLKEVHNNDKLKMLWKELIQK
jgi:hypothetical protein